jgi:recombinational DNA repair protein RecT
MTETTAIALTDEKVRGDVAKWSDLYIRPLYHGRDYTGWMLDAALCVLQSDELKEAIQSPQGKALFIRSLQLSAASGLSLNPQKGESALVAYKGKKGPQINFMPMKSGIVKLAMRTGKILKIESGTVFEKDEFIPRKTSEGDKYEWSPALKDRGPAKAYFAFVKLADGTGVLEYWEKSQAEAWAQKYGNGKAWDEANGRYSTDKFKPESAWGKSFDGMAEKTVIKAALRGLYLPEIEGYLDADEEREAEPAKAGETSLTQEIEEAERKAAEAAAAAGGGGESQGELPIY